MSLRFIGEISKVGLFSSLHRSYIFIIIQQMVLPVYKVLSLVIRVFSRPLISYTKSAHIRNDGINSYPFIRNQFIRLGNFWNRWQTIINRKLMKLETSFAYKPLDDDIAIQKGIQLFYEIIFYAIMILFPLYELYRGSADSKIKATILKNRVNSIQLQCQEIKKATRRLQIEQQQQNNYSIQVKNLAWLKNELDLDRKMQIKLRFPNHKQYIFDFPLPVKDK